MVTDWKMLVVWVQSVLGASEYDAAIVGMVEADEEVGVVANFERQMSFDVLEEYQYLLLECGVILQNVRICGLLGEDGLDVLANDGVNRSAERCKRVQRWL